MGTVYGGRHINLGRSIAIKLIGDGREFTRTVGEQVLREWRAHGRLSHPGIVTATDAGLVHGRPYLVTELIDGSDLARLIKRIGPLRLADASRVIHDVAIAMEYAHGAGVAHLDIKPSNIMINRKGQVKLLDLGTASISDLASLGTADNPALSAAGNFGTLGYLAPERMIAQPSNCVARAGQDIAADIYSLGCTFQFLLTGDSPFGTAPSKADSGMSVTGLIRAHRMSPPPAIPFRDDDSAAEDRQAVQALITGMLAKDPTRRPESMRSVAIALASLVDDARLDMLADESTCQPQTGMANKGPPSN